MEKVKKNVGLAGIGYWGKNILRNLYELDVLNTACDVDPAVVEKYSKNYPGANFTVSYDALLNNNAIEAVAIAVPAAGHYELAKKALLAGKDVFVEKPLAINTADGKELVELAKKEGRILMVGHILQYHPAVIKLKEMISSGTLGKIQYIYSNRLNIGKLRTEENILWSFAPHDISVILMLTEEEPSAVYSFGGDYLNAGINDVTLTTLEFKNGVKGHVFVSWLHPFKEQKLIVVGSKSMAVFDDLSEEKLFLYPHTVEWKDGKIPVAQKADFQVIPVEKTEPLKCELRHFVECVSGRKTPKTDGNEAYRVLKVLECAGKLLPENSAAFVHDTARVDVGVVIGGGTKIWHFSHVLKDSNIGTDCKIGQNVSLGPRVTIGNGCKIQNNVSIYEGVTLEDDVFCGPSCVFTNVINPRSSIVRMNELKKTLVKKGATIGANATIVCGNDLGKYCFIGAGAVVTNSVPDYALAYGNPARIMGWVCECGVKLIFSGNQAVCAACKKMYVKKDNKIEKTGQQS